MKKLTLFALLMAMLVLPARVQDMIELGKDVQVQELAPGIWRHVTYQVVEKKWKVPAAEFAHVRSASL